MEFEDKLALCMEAFDWRSGTEKAVTMFPVYQGDWEYSFKHRHNGRAHIISCDFLAGVTLMTNKASTIAAEIKGLLSSALGVGFDEVEIPDEAMEFFDLLVDRYNEEV